MLDPRTLHPARRGSDLRSVRKTGRLVVVDEARNACSAASHIAAVAAERAFDALRAPIRRVTTPDVAIPYSPALEKAVIPDKEAVLAAVRSVLGRPECRGVKVVLKLPRVSMNMEEATVTRWHKQPGETFAAGEALY